MLAAFRERYPDAVPLMPTLAADYLANPVGSLVTVRCAPWVRGRVALVGDAAHAIVPFFGQGANCAFEDCVELDRSLTAAGGDWPTALARYQAQRKPNADAIADMALENFVEMSERVASPVFRGQTQLRHALERALRRPLRLPLRAGVVHDDPVRRDRGPDPATGPDRRRGRGRDCSRPSGAGALLLRRRR